MDRIPVAALEDNVSIFLDTRLNVNICGIAHRAVPVLSRMPVLTTSLSMGVLLSKSHHLITEIIYENKRDSIAMSRILIMHLCDIISTHTRTE